MQQARPVANVKWLSRRRKPGRHRATPQQIVALRLRDFATLFKSRYRGARLPDDDDGRDSIPPVIHHFAALPQAARKARSWLEVWAPWLTLAEQKAFIDGGITAARAWKADQLAWRYNVTKEERTMLGLTTIGAVDHGKAARTKRRKELDRQRKARARRAKGIQPRRAYEATSVARAKPWEAEGCSRATWYRRRTHLTETETGPATA